MQRFKPYIIGFIIGAMAMMIFGVAAIKVAKSVKPLLKKIIVKISDRRFANVRKASRDLVIADFERSKSLDMFTQTDVEASLSDEFASEGKKSAKTMFRSAQAPSFKIGKYFERDKSFSNWAPYETFNVDIFNPQDKEDRLILQIKDTRGDKYKHTIRIEPKSQETVEIEITSLRKHLSVYRIAQINIFRWNPGNNAVFFIDNMRLVARGKRTQKSIFDPVFANSKEPAYATGDYFRFPSEKWQANPHGYTFPVYALNPAGVALETYPVEGGFPFPKGQLRSQDEIAVKDKNGRELAYQSKIAARWDDGSIKWLLLNMPTTLESAKKNEYLITYPSKAAPKTKERLAVERAEGITVDTGRLKFFISKNRFRLFDKVWLDGKELVANRSDMTIQFRKELYRSSYDKNYNLTIEENGPLAATLKAEGWFLDRRGRKYCKFLVRIKAYKNELFVRVYHTFIYTGYPENSYHYLYKGKRLPKNETIEEAAVEIAVPEIGPASQLAFGADGKVIEAVRNGVNIKVLCPRDDYYEVVENGKAKVYEGEKLDGWADVTFGRFAIAAIVRKLWQQYPKAFEIDRKQRLLRVILWPKEAGELDLKTTERANGPEAVARGSAFGWAKTHEIIFCFHEGNYKSAKISELSAVSQTPPVIAATPDWVGDTRALGALAAYEKKRLYFDKYEACVERLFDWGQRQLKKFRWYGMVNFGDVLTDYGQGNKDAQLDTSGWYRDGRWGWFNNSVMGLNLGCFLQFLRTGDYRYFEFGEDNTRHVMDVDTCHYNTVANDSRLRRRIPDDYSQVGSTHRHNADHWGGRNEMAGYTNLNGILLYYYLTGNERARDVAKEMGEFFLKRPVTYYKHPDIAPGRAIANILWGEVALYEATQDARFKKEADYWANVFFRGQNKNGGWNEDYNPETDRWNGEPHHMYMSGYIVPALVEYHKLTQNKAIADSIIKSTDYLIKHDQYYPFFDGLSYSYYITGDKKYLEAIQASFDFFERSQRKQDDPLWNGMIFQKLTYTRNAYFVYSMPYAFQALLDGYKREDDVQANTHIDVSFH